VQFHVAGSHSLPHRAKKDRRLFRRSRLIPALFLLLACTIPSLPDVWTQDRHIGPFDLAGSIWGLAAALCVASVSFHVRQGWVTIVSLLGMCAMILLGVVESYVLGFDLMVYDIIIFAAIPVGAAWAFSTTKSEKRLFMWALYCINWAVLAGTNYLLIHRKIQQSAPGPRVFVYSEFYCTWALSVLTPFIYFDKALWVGKKNVIAQALLVSTILLMALTARVSITRSVVLQLALCLAIVAAGLVKLQKLTVRWLLAAVAGVTLVIGFSLTPSAGGSPSFGSSNAKWSLEKRFSSTNLTGEERVAELRQVLMLYGGDLFVGRGLGSGFASVTISRKGSNYTTAPHIAVFTLLMKGGVLAFALGIVLPTLWTFKTIIFTDDAELYASCAGVLLYVAFSCISGGWLFPFLFSYGFFLSHVLTLTIRTRSIRQWSTRPFGGSVADHSER
jgi:hypothetical protein